MDDYDLSKRPTVVGISSRDMGSGSRKLILGLAHPREPLAAYSVVISPKEAEDLERIFPALRESSH